MQVMSRLSGRVRDQALEHTWQLQLKVTSRWFILMQSCVYTCASRKILEVRGKPGGNPELGDGLRLVFILCAAFVRAGKAKLRLLRGSGSSSSRWLWLWSILFHSGPFCEAQDVVYMRASKQNGSKSDPRGAHCVLFA